MRSGSRVPTPVLEEPGEIRPQRGRVAFDGDGVMGRSYDQVVGPLARRQQGLGGEVFRGDVEGVQQGDGPFDGFGLLDLLIAVERPGTDFLGV